MAVFETKSLASNRGSVGLTVFVKAEIIGATGGGEPPYGNMEMIVAVSNC